MLILALDTCLDTFSVALVSDGECLAEVSGGRPRTHLTQLYAAWEHVLSLAGVSLDQVQQVAVTVGPGSFTGVRLGVLAARTLGQIRGLPVVAVDTLEALALNCPCQASLNVALDARRGEVYAGTFEVGPEQARCTQAPGLYTPPAWAATLTPATVVVGNALGRYAELVNGPSLPPDAWTVRAHCVARAARPKAPISWRELVPVYLRGADAQVHGATSCA